jgi:8-oxo-dGTP pyrophosphatase MutT (NUDIX family)
MNMAAAVTTMTDIERRLRAGLADTHLDTPRPISDLELPLKLDKLLAPRLLSGMRAAAVLAPVIRRGNELTMLLTVRAQALRAHGGQISFPGGRRDDSDDGAVANALREAQEEIGLDPDRVEVLGYLDDYPTLTRFLVTPVVGLIDGEPELRADAGEVAEIFEVPLTFVLDPRSYQRRILSRDGLNVPFFELNWRQYRIWGATAGMLWNLTQKVMRHE